MMESNINKASDYAQLPDGLTGLLEKNKDATFYGVASGRSMEGVGIFDGDVLLIDRSLDVKPGDVIVAVLNGQFVCKIADLKNNQLLSASDEYEPYKLKDGDEFTLEGVVSRSVRMFRRNIKDKL
ncbi:S24 family peptidase [Pseudoalteromonas agarivorans]|uniref:LexA family protein n=1 Tax=Pseudoalteromonas TaxID=53246 RepID=UPI00110AF47A|nr:MULTISPECIES: S24 family peptidase [Pseudoalteromonas]MCQ8884482.1 S24 family peptidase [Pseudoalteromonas agarivorans]TMO16742.1 DNA polymerase V [Pseudoalteromonas sp. S326]